MIVLLLTKVDSYIDQGFEYRLLRGTLYSTTRSCCCSSADKWKSMKRCNWPLTSVGNVQFCVAEGTWYRSCRSQLQLCNRSVHIWIHTLTVGSFPRNWKTQPHHAFSRQRLQSHYHETGDVVGKLTCIHCAYKKFLGRLQECPRQLWLAGGGGARISIYLMYILPCECFVWRYSDVRLEDEHRLIARYVERLSTINKVKTLVNGSFQYNSKKCRFFPYWMTMFCVLCPRALINTMVHRLIVLVFARFFSQGNVPVFPESNIRTRGNNWWQNWRPKTGETHSPVACLYIICLSC